MKQLVDKVSMNVHSAEKSWGTYTVMDAQTGSMTVKLSMRAGKHLSYHSHDYREEVWNVVSGRGRSVVDGMEQMLCAGDVVMIAPGCKHMIEAETDLDIIEVQIGDNINVYDKHKYELE